MLNALAKYLGAELVKRLAHSLIEKLTAWLVDKKIREIQENTEEHDTERYYLLRAISNAETNEERKFFSIQLASLHRGELPKSNN